MKITDMERMLRQIYATEGDLQILCSGRRIAGLAVATYHHDHGGNGGNLLRHRPNRYVTIIVRDERSS